MLEKVEGNILSRVRAPGAFPKFRGKPLLYFGCFRGSSNFSYAKYSVIVRLAISEVPKIL